MKKYLAILLAVAMVLSWSVVGFANDDDTETNSLASSVSDDEEKSNDGDDDDDDDDNDDDENDGEDETPVPAPPAPVVESTVDAAVEANREAQEAAVETIENAVEAAVEGKSAAGVKEAVTASGESVPAVSVNLTGLNASLSFRSMERAGNAGIGLNVNIDNGAAKVLIPGDIDLSSTPGVYFYPMGYQKDPVFSGVMLERVKEPDAKSEACRLGGGELPAEATVSLKSRLTGPVNVYKWDDDTRRVTLVATGTAQNGRVIFATKQLGNLIITTGTI